MSQNLKIVSLIKEADFIGTLFFSLVGRKPSKKEKTILNAILVSSLALNPENRGVITKAMDVFKEISGKGDDIEKSSIKLVDYYINNKEKISGFGHPYYKDFDPRAKSLFEVARKNELDIQFMNIARQIEHSLEDRLDQKFVLNIYGAIAALLLTLDIDSLAGESILVSLNNITLVTN
jgi:hypothetical protein